jgi:hypothetical protein
MTPDLNFEISTRLWKYQGKSAWHFITLPEKESDEVRFFAAAKKSAWGSIRVTATIGETTWMSSIFPDSSRGVYVLPVKAAVRKAEKLGDGDLITLQLIVAV